MTARMYRSLNLLITIYITGISKLLHIEVNIMGAENDKNIRQVVKLTCALGNWTVKQMYRGAKFSAKTIYNHRDEIAGTAIGIVRGTSEIAKDTYGHTIKEKDFIERLNIMKQQSERYQKLTSQYYGKKGNLLNPRRTLVDSLTLGMDFINQYVFVNSAPSDVQRAFELAYPRLAESKSISEAVNGMDDTQLNGLVMGIKGKLFELKYADYLNNGHLPNGYSAQLAESATNPGWDIAIADNHGAICQELQLKATESINYIREAFERYPHIDIVTTDEVYSHLAMQGFSEHVINSGIDDQDLTDIIHSSLDEGTPHFDWMPSIIPFALIAFSVSRQDGLTGFRKGKQFGERSSKSYAAYLAGGAVAVATNTWWVGLIATVSSRFLLGIGRKKRERLDELKKFIAINEKVLKRMELKAARI